MRASTPSLSTSMVAPAHRTTRRISGPLDVLDLALQWTVRLVWLNACWLGLTLLGCVVLGIGPATSAAMAVAERWFAGEEDVPVARTMWSAFRQDIVRVNAPLLLLGAVALGLLTTLLLTRSGGLIDGAVVQGLATAGLLVVAAAAPHIVWVATRAGENGTLRAMHVLPAALALGIGRPFLTVTLLLIGAGWPAVLVLTGWPGLLPVVGASVPITASVWCLRRTLAPPEPRPSR